MNKKLYERRHDVLVTIFGIAVLMAFVYGSAGCAPMQPRASCPPSARERIQSTMVIEQCRGAGRCKMLMTVCMTEGDPE